MERNMDNSAVTAYRSYRLMSCTLCGQSDDKSAQGQEFKATADGGNSESATQKTGGLSEAVRTRFAPYEQTYPNSCGAASLLVIACALGINEIPPFAGSRSERANVNTLKLNDRCEADIYRITSDCDSSDEDVLERAGYSLPHNIVKAGKLLGLTSEVYEDSSYLSSAISWFYSAERDLLLDEGIPIKKSAVHLGEDQFEMKALAITFLGAPVGLHWVVALPDGTFMDPREGKCFDSFIGLQSSAGKSILETRGVPFGVFLENTVMSYLDTGISLVFSLLDESSVSLRPNYRAAMT
jgi:cysteine protease IpaJ